MHGRRRSAFIEDRDRDLAVLQSEWPSVLKEWREWLAAYLEDRLNVPIAYTDTQGNPHENSAWQIILHLVNHGTHHLGQVSGFLRAFGHTPLPLDLIYFYREL